MSGRANVAHRRWKTDDAHDTRAIELHMGHEKIQNSIGCGQLATRRFKRFCSDPKTPIHQHRRKIGTCAADQGSVRHRRAALKSDPLSRTRTLQQILVCWTGLAAAAEIHASDPVDPKVIARVRVALSLGEIVVDGQIVDTTRLGI